MNPDDYKTKKPYPKRTTQPIILMKKAGDLTPNEILSLSYINDQYKAAVATEKADVDAYRADEARLLAQLQADLAAAHGLKDHPKADMLWGKAWDHGHSSGLSSVMAAYEDMAELLT